MIGTSDGEQYDSSFEHTIASRMPAGASGEPAGALNEVPRYPTSGAINPNVASVLSQPHIAEAIANPKIDRSHDVPYEAGASAKPDDFTTHIDKHIPTSVTLSGQTFDPAIPANIHEQTEREVMNNLIKKGMSNEKAYEIAHHEYAEPAEDAWYRANGVKVEDANKWWASQDKTTEKETSTDKNFPKDLYKKPYPHNEVEGVKHEPSGVSAEWPLRTGLSDLDVRLDLSNHSPGFSSKYDMLPMSKNIEDRRNEVSDMAKNAKSLDDLIDQLETMDKLGTPEDRARYYKEMDKPENVTDPLSRKSGILDLIEQIRKLNENK